MPETSEAAYLSDERLRLVLDAAPDGIGVVENGRLVYANRSLRRLLSDGRAGTIGSEPPLPGALRELAEEATLGFPGRGRIPASGAGQALEVWAAPLDRATTPAVGVFVRGGAESAPLERGLERAERLASLGQLAAGVAHEINNPLAYVLGSIELAERGLDRLSSDGPDGVLQALENARNGAERVGSIVRELLALSPSPAEHREGIQIEEILEATIDLVWSEIQHRSRLIKHFSGVPGVSGDRARLTQAFLSLLINAAQSIEPGARRAEIHVITRLEGERVVVEIRDTGAGISPERLPHVFEPFFDAARSRGGTGLGLSICQSIVRAHGGDIGVESQLGRGSTFRVSLPRGEPRAAEAMPARASSQRRRAGAKPARILVIDDEPLLGQTLTFALSGRHEVAICSGGRQALSVLSDDAGFDLVLCDLMMPDVTGAHVLEHVAEAHPELLPRFVFMTGGAFTDSAQAFLESYQGRRLEKPFTIADVEQLLLELTAA